MKGIFKNQLEYNLFIAKRAKADINAQSRINTKTEIQPEEHNPYNQVSKQKQRKKKQYLNMNLKKKNYHKCA